MSPTALGKFSQLTRDLYEQLDEAEGAVDRAETRVTAAQVEAEDAAAHVERLRAALRALGLADHRS